MSKLFKELSSLGTLPVAGPEDPHGVSLLTRARASRRPGPGKTQPVALSDLEYLINNVHMTIPGQAGAGRAI